MNRFFFLAVFLSGIFSCTTSSRISRQDLSYLYRENGQQLNVEFRVFNFSADSTRIYFQFNTDDILYKNDFEGAFKATVLFTFYVLENYESSEAVDTFSTVITDKSNGQLHQLIFASVGFRKPTLSRYIIHAAVKDINRMTKNDFYVSVNNSSGQSEVNFLVTDTTDAPLFSNMIQPEQKFRIYTSSQNRKLFMRFFNLDFPLAPPPHKTEEPKKFNYTSVRSAQLDLQQQNEFALREKGIYHFQPDTTIKQGLTLFRFDDDYPETTEPSQLIEPLRYMTTRKEYTKILQSKNKKQAIDDFWIQLAGNEKRGKELIRVYYSRVVNANRWFTSYFEGWKTDRGLIYLIFGAPDVVYKSDKVEDWNYSVSVDRPELNFTFEKINNPFTENDYYLRRSQQYEVPWFIAVDKWRQGVRFEE